MKIETPHFGALDVDPSKVIEFPRGLIGFGECTRFSLFHEAEGEPVVHTLQSLDQPDLAFSVADPAVFGLKYELTLTDEESALIGMAAADEIGVVVILYRSDEKDVPVKANVMAPLVINARTRKGLQQSIATVGSGVTFKPIAP